MTRSRVRAATLSLILAVTALLAVLMAPATTLSSRVGPHRRLADEDGEIVQNILWVAGFAAIAIAVIAIIRTFVLSEAQNLPTSGGG